ncbi:MAG TPA: hypothetical protein VGQ51_13210 [Puia sp.]|jgi:hypothetical protein|nr:hypothetical protein [Puia sp.]
MQRKENNKGKSLNTEPETAEQKEIRLLKKRVFRAKQNAAMYEKWWRDGAVALDKARKYIELLTRMEKSARDMFEITKKQWEFQQREIENLRKQRDGDADGKGDGDISQEAAQGLRDMLDEGLSLQEMIDRATPEQLIIISQSQRKVLGDGLGTFEDRMKLIEGFKQKAYKEILEEDSINNGPRRDIFLICVAADSDGLLDEFSRYSSPGLKRYSGCDYYPINELKGKWFPAELFHKSSK